jgi:hypothetical protein
VRADTEDPQRLAERTDAALPTRKPQDIVPQQQPTK